MNWRPINTDELPNDYIHSKGILSMDLISAYNGVFIRLGLYILIFWPIVGYYVYVKSKERGLTNPKMRGIVLGFLGIPGLLIHLWTIQSRE